MLSQVTLIMLIFNLTLIDAMTPFMKSCLDLHNSLRGKHGKHRMSYDAKAEAHAKHRAHQLSKSCAFNHDGNHKSGYGENLAGGPSGCNWAVNAWYNEIKYYKSPTFSSKTGHFTQVVWNSSVKLGCAQATHCKYRYVTVCSYYPPGNVIGNFKKNVW